MAKLNLEYYSGENHYSDGDIEEEILKIAKEGKKLSELGQVEFPILYHLSAVRENILNWYPFRKDGTCLEIGSGCGALTGLLCERVRKVTSVELSKRRADINFARNHEKENLEIMVGNQNDMVFPEKFDYIVLNGVFEYAMSFTAGEKPYEDFLSYIAGFLKEDGILLIAIENRLGLKYFAGAPEDHTNAYMDGLKGYPGNASVRTFSKSEWVELMRTCGLENYKFYYPYPDYKFPCEVFTDETLVSQKYGRKNWNFTENRFELFPEQEMAETFRKEGVMDRFANSFLIEMSKRPIQRETEVLYAKMNRDRADAFAIVTKIERTDGRMQVTKSALTVQAKAHLERMHGNEGRKEGSLKLLKGAYQPGNITYPYLTGNSLGYEANMAIQNRQPERVKKLVREAYEFCVTDRTEVSEKEPEAFAAVFGSRKGTKDYTYVRPANIDLILDNIFRDGECISVIDGEWVFDFPVPAEFIIWRTINEIYTNAAWFEEQLPRNEFLKEYGIEEEDAGLFHDWAEHFEKEYVKANGLADYAVPEVGVNLEEIRRRRIQEIWMDSTLYLDTGNGFSEEETVKAKTKLAEGRLELTLRLPQGKEICALRFDPLEGRPCICELDADGARLTPVNAAEQKDKRAVFLTTDPAYQVEIKENVPQVLRISGAIEVKDKDWALREYQQRAGNMGRRWRFWK